MKFSEAMALYEQGKKVRSIYWAPHDFISKELALIDSIDQLDWNSEWELYEEPVLPEKERHWCNDSFIDCKEDDFGLVLNTSLANAEKINIYVNYCPICGYKCAEK